MKIIITGGGAYFFGNEMKEEFKKKEMEVIIPEEPEFANVKGFLEFAD